MAGLAGGPKGGGGAGPKGPKTGPGGAGRNQGPKAKPFSGGGGNAPKQPKVQPLRTAAPLGGGAGPKQPKVQAPKQQQPKATAKQPAAPKTKAAAPTAFVNPNSNPYPQVMTNDQMSQQAAQAAQSVYNPLITGLQSQATNAAGLAEKRSADAVNYGNWLTAQTAGIQAQAQKNMSTISGLQQQIAANASSTTGGVNMANSLASTPGIQGVVNPSTLTAVQNVANNQAAGNQATTGAATTAAASLANQNSNENAWATMDASTLTNYQSQIQADLANSMGQINQNMTTAQSNEAQYQDTYLQNLQSMNATNANNEAKYGLSVATLNEKAANDQAKLQQATALQNSKNAVTLQTTKAKDNLAVWLQNSKANEDKYKTDKSFAYDMNKLASTNKLTAFDNETKRIAAEGENAYKQGYLQTIAQGLGIKLKTLQEQVKTDAQNYQLNLAKQNTANYAAKTQRLTARSEAASRAATSAADLQKAGAYAKSQAQMAKYYEARGFDTQVAAQLAQVQAKNEAKYGNSGNPPSGTTSGKGGGSGMASPTPAEYREYGNVINKNIQDIAGYVSLAGSHQKAYNLLKNGGSFKITSGADKGKTVTFPKISASDALFWAAWDASVKGAITPATSTLLKKQYGVQPDQYASLGINKHLALPESSAVQKLANPNASIWQLNPTTKAQFATP